MRQLGLTTYVKLLAIAAMAFAFSACQKRCGSGSTPSINSFVGQQFRLIQTNDPSFKDLSNYNFIIMHFDDVRFQGDVKTVKDNEIYNTPALTFAYNVDTTQKILRIQYSYPAAGGSQGQSGSGATQSSTTTTVPPKDYSYAISGHTFQLMDQNGGTTYTFVPYTGAVRPDDTCTF